MSACEHCGEEHEEGTRFCPSTGRLIAARLLPAGSLLEGKYRIGRSLGVGGMGAVFEAEHALLGHKVAIKVLLPELSRDASMTARLVREGRAACATGHPNIAMVTDMGSTTEGGLFVVMEYIDGKTLNDIVDESGPLPIERVVALIVQVLAGLEAVHQSSIIHRDLKPDNIMVIQRDDTELVKILDFGISKILDDEAMQELTSTGLVIGTPAFMAPEQSREAATVDHRADIYSVGAICYKLLTGAPPLTASNLAILLAKLVQGEIQPPSTKRPGLPPELDQAIMRSLALDPAARFPDARSFRRALESFASNFAQCAKSHARRVREDNFSASVLTAPAAPSAPPPDFDIDETSDVVSLDAITRSQDPVAEEPASRPPPRSIAALPRPEPPSAPPTAPGSFSPPEEDDSPLQLDRDRPAMSQSIPPSDAYNPDPDSPLSSSQGSARLAGNPQLPRLLMILGAVIVLAGGLWYLAGDKSTNSERPQLQIVTITLVTIPAEVDIFVDNVLQVDAPIRLPKSNRTFMVRVSAKDHRAQTLRVTPDRDQKLEIVLTKRRRRDDTGSN